MWADGTVVRRVGLWRGKPPLSLLAPDNFDSDRVPSIGTKSIYALLLVYAASTTTTTLPCLAVILSTPVVPSAVTETAKAAGLSITAEQRLLLLSSYIPFFLVPLVMTLDMALRVHTLVTVDARKTKRD